MTRDWLRLLIFIITLLVFFSPWRKLIFKNHLINFLASSLLYLSALYYLYSILGKPLLFSFLAFAAVAVASLFYLMVVSTQTLFNLSFIAYWSMVLFYLFKLPWVAEAAAVLTFILLISAFLSRYLKNYYE